MKKQSNDRTNWYNVRLNESTQTFVESFRARIQEDYQLELTKDVVLRALIEQGLRSISLDLLNEDPMFLFRTEEASK